MKKILFSLVVFTGLVFAEGFTLKSSNMSGQLSNEQVFNGFGCKGDNISPALSWSNAPKGTKSFALTVYDPDAPTGSGWWHWVVFDIPANITSLVKNSGDIKSMLMPKGAIQGVTDFGKAGYGGACPPVAHKAHKYIFTIYALDTDKLGLDKKASPALVGYYLNLHVLGKASIVGYYDR